PRIDRDRAGPDLDDRPPLLFSMSPNRATASGKSNFSGLSPVGAPGRVAGGHFRRVQPSRFAHGCAPTGEHLRGNFLVERNSFRFSVPLVPFERANRSEGKKRNEFRSTAPRLPTPRGSRLAGRMAIGRSACSLAVPRATEAGLGSNGRSGH